MSRIYTQRGKGWELANSWWFLATLAPLGMCSSIAFLYIGFRVRRLRWKIWGGAYLASFSILFYVLDSKVNALVDNIGTAVLLIIWIISIFHAFRARPDFLIRLDIYKASEKMRDQQRINQIRQEMKEKLQPLERDAGYQPPPLKQVRADSPDPIGEEESREASPKDANAPGAAIDQTIHGRRVDY